MAFYMILGTCSTHFDDGARGFSFQNDGPLDMRFNTSKGDPLSLGLIKLLKKILWKFYISMEKKNMEN